MQADLQFGEKENKRINVIHTLVQRENSVRLKIKLKKKKINIFFCKGFQSFCSCLELGNALVTHRTIVFKKESISLTGNATRIAVPEPHCPKIT